jgi:hypothetical protein
VVFIVVITVVLLVKNVFFIKTHTLGYKNAHIKYHYLKKNINETLSETDSEEIKKILNNRILYTDNPSCGFVKDISLQFNDGKFIFSIACDGDPIFKDEKTGKYFNVSEEERNQIDNILKKYGATFPAV